MFILLDFVFALSSWNGLYIRKASWARINTIFTSWTPKYKITQYTYYIYLIRFTFDNSFKTGFKMTRSDFEPFRHDKHLEQFTEIQHVQLKPTIYMPWLNTNYKDLDTRKYINNNQYFNFKCNNFTIRKDI